MGIKVKVERELDDEFVGDVLVTAFDGQYGACWYWCHPAGRFAFNSTDHSENCATHHAGFCNCSGGVWTDVTVMLDEPLGEEPLDSLSKDGIKVDAEVIRIGIERILDMETSIGDSIREYIVRGVLEGDAGDIDAIAADCIVQAGWFGKVIFG